MKYNDNGTYRDIYVKSFDTLPVGAEVDYDGNTVPTGWTEITDIQPSVYATTETICGTWIDGKPLYRKVLTFPNGTGQTTQKTYTLSDYGITNVNEIFIVHPSYYTLTGSTYPFQYNDGTAFECKVSSTQLLVLLGYIDIANSKFVITLEYTKTTD